MAMKKTPSFDNILADLRIARAFLDRVEHQMRYLYGNAPKNAAQRVSDDSLADETSSPSNASHCGFSQDEMFPEIAASAAASQEGKERNVSHKKGCPTLTRRQTLANFRKIAKNRVILDIADVNEIFGYSRTTSGTFIRHAVKRGALRVIPQGKMMKFLTADVKAFIREFYDYAEDGGFL